MLRVREVRRAKDITQEEFARRMGVSQSTVSDWETEQAAPSIITFMRMAKELGCSLDYLAGLSDTNIEANAG